MINKRLAKIQETVITFGVSDNLAGSKYIIQALYQMYENENTHINDIYEFVAKANNISCRSLVSVMNNIINKAAELNNENYKKFFGNLENAPSSPMFLKTIKEKMLICSEN